MRLKIQAKIHARDWTKENLPVTQPAALGHSGLPTKKNQPDLVFLKKTFKIENLNVQIVHRN